MGNKGPRIRGVKCLMNQGRRKPRARDEESNYKYKEETFEERPILLKFKEGENIALTLHFVQPQEYIEVFRG